MIAIESDFNILIVEDDQRDYMLIQDLLWERFPSPSIAHARSYRQAMKLINTSKKPDVILIDLTLPDFSGDALMSDIKNLAKEIPVIFLTAPETSVIHPVWLSDGIADYVPKNELTASSLFKSITYSLERQKNLRRLTESESKYKTLFKASPIPMWIYDLKTLKFLDVNDAAVKNYGYSRDEFLSMTIEQIRPDEDVDILRRAVKKVRETGKNPAGGTYRHKKKNGQIIDVQLESSEIDVNGKMARLAVSLDITDRLRFERALEASEKRFKFLIQEGGELITIVSPEGEFVYVSPNHETILGYSSKEVTGKNIIDYLHPDDYPRTIRLYKNLLGRRRVFSNPFRLRHADGRWIWFESIITNALDDSDINGFAVISRDVTQRVENEKKLRESNDRFEAIAKATSDAIYDYDFRSRKIYISGSSYQALFGYKFEGQETDIEFFKSCLHPDEKQRVFEMMNKTVEDPSVTHFEIEYKFRKADGSYADILDRFNIIWSNGEPIKKVGAMQDISMKKFQSTVLAFEKEIYELNANPKIAFDFVLNKLVLNVEALIPGAHGLILSFTEDKVVRQLAGSTITSNYVRALEDILKSDWDSTHAWLQGTKASYVPNMQSSEFYLNHLEAITHFGYVACWTVPVKKRSSKISSAISLHFKEERMPSEQEKYVLERATNLIGILIENRSYLEETESAKERYDIVAKATSDTIWDWKIQEDSFSWNKGIQGVFGYKKEEVGKTSKWWFDRVHPEDSIRVSVKLYNFLEEKVEKWQDEYRFACADGTYKYVFDRGFLVKDADGKPIRMIGAMQDVTRQKEEEQRLKLLETVVTQTKDAVIITEAEKSKKGSIPKIVFVNPAFTYMTGYKAKEVVGKSPAIFMGRKSIANEIAKLSEALKNKKEYKFETLNHKKNGEEYWVNFSMIPITNKEGEHSHWISIQRDITEEKRQEKEKEQLIRELTQNNKDLKQFSYITSHNLRAPLSNLTGLLNLMEDIPVENPELREILNGFSKSTHLLNETINDLVRVVIIKDNPSIQKEEVLIKDVFENVFNQLSFMISVHKPIIKIELEKVSILNINKAYLESILLNLLTNAIKYRSPNRQLRIYISSKQVGNDVILTFRDNGIGIDLERNGDKIFGLYQRFHNYPDSKGLGLYLVKSQVETMGGSITVQSEVNKGTTFTLTFKANPDA